MRTIYIDSECKCHVTNDGTMTAIETSFFDRKCNAFIEGYCVKQNAIYPWKPFSELDAAQRAYEQAQLSEYEALIDELYAEVTS